MIRVGTSLKHDPSIHRKRRLQPQGSDTQLTEHGSTQKRLKQPMLPTSKCEPPWRSAAKPAIQDGEVLAIRRYEDLQDRLQQIFWDCNKLWRSSTSYDKDGPRKSWRAAMGHFQVLLTATLSDALNYTETSTVSTVTRSKLGNAAALLWIKNQRQESASAYQNHMTHLQEVTQATSEQVCWKIILDELLTNETLRETTRRQQASYLTTQLHNTSIKLQAAIQRAQSYAVLQNLHKTGT
jgi:hypothetical protein